MSLTPDPYRSQSPAELYAIAAAQDATWLQPGSTFRDCWVAAHFAAYRGAESVRLLKPDSRAPAGIPDAEMRIGGQAVRFEITEAMSKERRRGDEFKPDAPRLSHHRADMPDFLESLKRSADDKAAKRYPPSTGLVIYLDHSGRNHVAFSAPRLAVATLAAAECMAFVYLITDSRIGHVWQGLRHVGSDEPLPRPFV
jgi:hypothetical protein